ncbi:unnamed protein product [Schistosoma margrebowiei]|uniref:Uncharacterized protein n=1 Tax=Schistosoma margrebowiei TaxID=48269 RepID=A0A183M507_9TREM|nr:unnamed protein product [Schistosoma margrebowiei]
MKVNNFLTGINIIPFYKYSYTFHANSSVKLTGLDKIESFYYCENKIQAFERTLKTVYKTETILNSKLLECENIPVNRIPLDDKSVRT